MAKVYMGKNYTWTGSDYTDTTGEYRFLTKGTGDTIKDNGTTAPQPQTSTDWIISDDMGDMDISRCMVRVKATKTAGSVTSLHTHFDCWAIGLIDGANEWGEGNNGSGEGVTCYVTCKGTSWGTGSHSVQNGGTDVDFLQLSTGGPVNGYCYFKFAADPTSGLITPFQFVAVAFPIEASASISGHTYQFEAQWVYA